mmetsp:Transcript_2984/g.4860  ORF Transcript_2984/g.4860 Transcript_2984/m.4860 type:complete len:239 (+) Transcript_2984:1112-1828(+)
MLLDCFRHNKVRIISLPSPFLSDRVLVVSPAKDTLVRTCKRRRCLHALVGSDSVKGVLVAATSSSQLMLGPTTQLDSTVSTDKSVAFLLESQGLGGSCHCLRFRGLFFGGRLEHRSAHIFEVDNFRFFLIFFIEFVVRFFIVVRLLLFAFLSGTAATTTTIILAARLATGTRFRINCKSAFELRHYSFCHPLVKGNIRVISNSVISNSCSRTNGFGSQLAKLLKGFLGRFSDGIIVIS